jgi:gliding motility-associated-like protein
MNMKGISKKLGLLLALITFFGMVINAQVADFEYFDPCEGAPAQFVSTSTYPAGITSYRWHFNDGTGFFFGSEVYHTFPLHGIYYVTLDVYNSNLPGDSLVSSKSRNVAIYRLPDPSFLSEGICFGDSVVFVNTTTSMDGDVIAYEWNFGDGEGDLIPSPAHWYAQTGTYSVSLTVETVYGCRNTYTGDAYVYRLPDATIMSDDLDACSGEEIELTVSDEYEKVIWSTLPSETFPNIEAYSIKVKTTDGPQTIEVSVYEIHYETGVVCSSSSTVDVIVHPTPVITVTASETFVIAGSEVILDVTSQNANLVGYWWTPVTGMNNPAAKQPALNLYETTEFTVTVVDEFGCRNTGSVLVEVDLKPNNIITPNGDGKNDVWIASKRPLNDDYEVAIFNRWGEEILNQKGYNNDWDGTSNGDSLPEGAYFYVIKYKGVAYTGSITLLR